MHYLKKFYIKNFKYELVNKFFYRNVEKLPKLKKIVLNFGCKEMNIKKVALNLLALELITNKRSFLKRAKQPNLIIKIKKGNPAGCVVTLQKNLDLNFIAKILKEIFIKIKKFGGLVLKYNNKNSLSYSIKNSLNFNCLNQKNHYLFKNLSSLNITIITKNNKKKETLFFFKCLQLPLLKSKMFFYKKQI